MYIEKIMFPDTSESLGLKEAYYKENPANKTIFEDHLRRKYGGCWEFNEIIGYIKLHFLGSQIRGEYYQVAGRSIRKSRAKQFEFVTHKLAPEIEIDFGSTNAEIFERVIQYMADCQEELRGRFLDTSILENIGQHLNWADLLNQR